MRTEKEKEKQRKANKIYREKCLKDNRCTRCGKTKEGKYSQWCNKCGLQQVKYVTEWRKRRSYIEFYI